MTTLFDTHLPAAQFYCFAIALLFGSFSIFFFIRQQVTRSVILLFIAALILRFTMAAIDPFLNLWDEQFHALVAKNMLDHPFKPMLVVDPVLNFDMENWSQNHIWLHKQPLFLWQMMLSIKMFGVSEFALRGPSALMSALCVLLIFRIGKLAANERIGWCAAFLFAFSNFQLELAMGRVNTDHNDMAFMFYVLASIWAWVEYERNNKMKWVLLIGLFSGMAILVKWLPGLLVFAGWGMSILLNKEQRKKFSAYKPIGISFIITCIVFIPWQIYKASMFPIESAIEYKFYNLHFTMPLDGHDGPWWYHFAMLGEQFGTVIAWLIIPGLLLLFLAMKERSMQAGMLTFIVIIYLFFSLAQTKMPLLCVPVAPLLFLALGAVLEKITAINFRKRIIAQVIAFIILGVSAVYFIDFKTIENLHTDLNNDNGYRQSRMHNTGIAKQTAALIPSNEYVVFNCKDHNAILVMFYCGNTAYDKVPSESEYSSLKKRGVKMAVYDEEGLPLYLKNDSSVLKLDLHPTGF